MNPFLVQAGREKLVKGGMKQYLSVLVFRGTVRPLHGLFKQASKAQEYAENVLKKWKVLHGEKAHNG